MRTPIPALLAAQLPGAAPSRVAPVVPAGFGPAFHSVFPAHAAAAAQPARAAPARVIPPAQLFEAAMTNAAMGFHEAAIENLQDVTARAPGHAPAWRKLAALLRLAGKDAQAAAADETAARLGTPGIAWEPAAGERIPAKLDKTERKLYALLRTVPEDEWMTVLRDALFNDPLDVTAMRLLALEEWRAGDGVTALELLRRALALSPGFLAARESFIEVLNDRRAYVQAVEQTAIVLAEGPRNARMLGIRADGLGYMGRYAEAIEILEGLIAHTPQEPRLWLSCGTMLHAVGRREDAVRSYRTCLEFAPETGDAYWGLADLKGNQITPQDVAEMQNMLAANRLLPENKMRVCYALAHYYERFKDFPASFAAYEEGARAFRDSASENGHSYDPEPHSDKVRRLKKTFTVANLAPGRPRAVHKPGLATPIFVIGMPRAGSTLVEQIIASHSLVEGTRELSVVGDITRDLTLSRMMVTPVAYPDCVLDLNSAQLTELGERYVRDAGAYRTTDLPYFIDKRPWNWLDAGLIELMLPHAKLIDIRRAPMAACFAMFKQVLPVDAAFSYDLNALGRYYNEYVSMIEHYERAMPGRILQVQYERLVEDTEAEIRRILDYCGLPFEERCLRFWETDRAVATPSAEQVRRPIFRDALEQWRNFEQWLGPLKESLARPIRV